MRIIRIASIVAIAAATLSSVVDAASNSPKFLTGDAFGEKLVAPLGVSWSGTQLGDVVAGLSRTNNMAIVLDRRIDPQQPVALAVSDRPLIDVLAELARLHNLGMYLHGPVVCLPPPDEAALMEAAARERREHVARLPRSVARRWRAKSPMKWDELTTPAELLARLSKQGGFTIVNPQLLPHDLWGGGNLPKLSLADRLSFILGQFGLTYKIAPSSDNSTSRVKLVAIPDAPVAARSYPAGKEAKLLVEKWKSRSKRPKTSAANGGQKAIRIEKFTVSEAELESLLRQLAARLGLTLELD